MRYSRVARANQTGSPPATVTLTIYFTDVARYQVGTEPYEAAVTRVVVPVPARGTAPAAASLPEAVLTQLFLGPTETEKAQGLAVILGKSKDLARWLLRTGMIREEKRPVEIDSTRQ